MERYGLKSALVRVLWASACDCVHVDVLAALLTRHDGMSTSVLREALIEVVMKCHKSAAALCCRRLLEVPAAAPYLRRMFEEYFLAEVIVHGMCMYGVHGMQRMHHSSSRDDYGIGSSDLLRIVRRKLRERCLFSPDPLSFVVYYRRVFLDWRLWRCCECKKNVKGGEVMLCLWRVIDKLVDALEDLVVQCARDALMEMLDCAAAAAHCPFIDPQTQEAEVFVRHLSELERLCFTCRRSTTALVDEACKEQLLRCALACGSWRGILALHNSRFLPRDPSAFALIVHQQLLHPASRERTWKAVLALHQCVPAVLHAFRGQFLRTLLREGDLKKVYWLMGAQLMPDTDEAVRIIREWLEELWVRDKNKRDKKKDEDADADADAECWWEAWIEATLDMPTYRDIIRSIGMTIHDLNLRLFPHPSSLCGAGASTGTGNSAGTGESQPPRQPCVGRIGIGRGRSCCGSRLMCVVTIR